MRIVDCFCGCGGLSLGFQKAGYEIVGVFDMGDKALNVYQQNFDHPVYKMDVQSNEFLEKVKELTPDGIIGGRHVKIIHARIISATRIAVI